MPHLKSKDHVKNQDQNLLDKLMVTTNGEFSHAIHPASGIAMFNVLE
jgi:hypothetical protein